MATVIPILKSRDLAATAGFYGSLGFIEQRRFEDYLIMDHPKGFEIHFFLDPDHVAPLNTAGCYIRYATEDGVRSLHASWSSAQPDAVGPLAATDYGLLEFALLDDDVNQIRVGGVV